MILKYPLCPSFPTWYYINHYTLISDKYLANIIPKNGCSTIVLQSLCYNLNLDLNNVTNLEIIKQNHLSEISNVFNYFFKLNTLSDPFILINDYLVNPLNLNNKKIVFIFRNPVERFLSAWKTPLAKNSELPLDEFINIVEYSFKTNNINLIDQHVIPQHFFLGENLKLFDYINKFIELKEYPLFCKEKNIPWIMANENSSSEYKNFKISNEQLNKILDLYEDDYNLINLIKNSGKLYKPNN